MSDITIITNHHKRDILYWFELTPDEQKEFDWISADETDNFEFFRYRGNVYCLSDFMRVENNPALKYWDGYSSDSFFSGIVIKYPREDWGDIDAEHVICGLYLS